MKFPRRATLLLLTIVAVACAPAANESQRAASEQGSAVATLESDLEAIEAFAYARFQAFQNAPTPAEQAAAFVEGIAEDAVWMPPQASLVSGREAIRDWAEEYFSEWTLDIAASTDVKTMISGDLAVRRWVSMGNRVPRAGGAPVPFHQKSLEVLSRQPDGSWLISIRMWNSNSDGPK